MTGLVAKSPAVFDLVGLRMAVDDAANALREATRDVYPLGAVVEVTLGGNRIAGRVIGYGCDWINDHAEEVVIENIKTGKTRSFRATSESQAPERVS